MMLRVSPLGSVLESIIHPFCSLHLTLGSFFFFFLLLYLSPSCFYTSIFLPIPLPMFYILVLWVCLLFACCLLCSSLSQHLVLYVCITPRSDWCTIFTGQSPHKIKVCCVSLWIYTPSVASFPDLPPSGFWLLTVHCLVVRPRFMWLRNKGKGLGRVWFLKLHERLLVWGTQPIYLTLVARMPLLPQFRTY